MGRLWGVGVQYSGMGPSMEVSTCNVAFYDSTETSFQGNHQY